MIDGLNQQQEQAVTQAPGHTLVLAGAGSGKTRVLTTRMAWLMQQQQLSPFALLAVTFTNKAAREMLTRLQSLLPINTRGMWVGTFHGLCNRLLRTHFRDAGLVQSFQILDSSDQLAAIRRLIKGAGIDDEKFPPRDVQRFINGSKEEGLRPDAVEAYDPHRRRLAEIYQLYQDQCEREGVVDFAELLLRAYELLQRNAPIREHYQRRFQHILVDEFQDTNRLQYLWLKLLAGGGAAVFAVGDDDQSIYAFRGADVGNMADFERQYARGNVIKLEQNYRSCGHILDAANALISQNSSRLGKNLWTDAGKGELIRISEQPSDALEAQWVVDEVRALISEGKSNNEIAILYRSNAQSRVLEHHLFSSGISYKVYGGQRFFERQEIKHVLAYLRLVDNPNDDTSWLRVVNFPTRGIGARSLEVLGDHAREHGISLYRAVPYMTGRAGTNLGGFVAMTQALASEAQVLTLPELIQQVVHDSGLLAHYQADREGAERLENLQELVNAAAVFVNEENFSDLPAGRIPDAVPGSQGTEGLAPGVAELAPMSPLGAFLSHASLEAGDNQAQAGQDAVQLMTIHAAKGLEFDAVFITGLEEGLFPHDNSLNDPGGIEEERRLMYVAITRGRERLYITLAQSRMLHGQTRYAMRSRFLDELPEENVKWLTARAVPTRGGNEGQWGGAFRRGMSWNAPAGNTLVPNTSKVMSSGVIVGENHFRIGQGVRHAKFGEGTILTLSGSGNEAQAQIQFREVGTKTLALGIAKLDVVVG
ncbi:UvrD-helicase domain-containing protein [Paenalcaligenes niemegkensis]|uniref:UvrD-helicase domain-containing protein n=1 Tax=Paenalcaligenes niemegkensis TaxID=2895469 RepID=UPI001EE8F879|nr:UvrD-helicase domain-containing protein [Paenalcaligenes niemegkensis]MCQ9616596.1 UvrD-helicase domain-containing protein [Paenalcaligenes niemegkensis]